MFLVHSASAEDRKAYVCQGLRQRQTIKPVHVSLFERLKMIYCSVVRINENPNYLLFAIFLSNRNSIKYVGLSNFSFAQFYFQDLDENLPVRKNRGLVVTSNEIIIEPFSVFQQRVEQWCYTPDHFLGGYGRIQSPGTNKINKTRF